MNLQCEQISTSKSSMSLDSHVSMVYVYIREIKIYDYSHASLNDGDMV